MKIWDVMHKGAVFIAPGAKVSDVAWRMKQDDIGALPVVDQGRVIGIITDRDLAMRSLADGRDVGALTARDVMTPDAICCDEGADAESAIEMMEDSQVRRPPVLNSRSQLVGMVSLGDISHRMPQDISAEVLQAVSAHHA